MKLVYTFLMDSTTKNKLYSFLYLFAFYLAIRLLPLDKWCGSLTWLSKLLLILLFALEVFLQFWEARKIEYHYPKIEHTTPFLWIPFILGCGSNIFYCLCFSIPAEVSISNLFFLNILSTFLGVMIEEILFRYFFISFLDSLLKEDKWKNFYLILFSGLAFSLMHCINFFGNNPFSVLLQLGYTFVLGIVCSYLALGYQKLYLAVIGHFLFNFLNTDLFVSLYNIDVDTPYILFSLGIGIILSLYFVLIFYLNRRKQHGNIS